MNAEYRPSARLRDMALAGVALSLFGGGWMVVALNSSPGIWLLMCALLPTSLLVLRSLSLLHTSGAVREREPAPTLGSAEAARAVSRRGNLIFALEVGTVVVAANLLNAYGRGSGIVAAVGFIVGAYFAAWARAQDNRLYYWTGGVEIVVCAIVVGVTAVRGRLGAGDPLIGLDMALTLWITVVVLLTQGGHWGARLIAAAPDPARRA